MYRLSRLTAPGVLVAAALAISACMPQVSTTRPARPVQTPTPVAPDPAAPVRVALLAPSGAANAGAAALGRALVNAAQLGAEDLGDPGLELMIYDTAGDASTAARVMQQALGAGARLILGPLFSANTKAINATASANGINVISFSTDITAAGGPVYLSGFLPQKEAARVIGYARSRGIEATGIFYPQSALGEITYRGAQDAAGPGLVAATAYERTTSGIVSAGRRFASEVRSTGAQGVLVAESGQALIFVMETLAAQDIDAEKVRFLGLGQWNSASILQSPRFANAWFPAPDPDAMASFVARYRTRFGQVPPTLAVLGYDAVQIAGQLLAAARADGSPEPFSAAALTRPEGFQGATGPIRFGPDGLGERAMVIMEVGEATFEVVDPAPAAFGLGS